MSLINLFNVTMSTYNHILLYCWYQHLGSRYSLLILNKKTKDRKQRTREKRGTFTDIRTGKQYMSLYGAIHRKVY